MSTINIANIKMYRPLDKTETTNYGGDIDLNSEILTDTLENVFDNVSDQERIQGDTEYRKIFVKNHNTGAGSDWLNVKCWIFSPTLSPDDEISIALGVISPPDTLYEAQGYDFVTPDAIDHEDVLDIGTLLTNEIAAIWVKRIVSPSAEKYYGNEFQLAFRSSSI